MFRSILTLVFPLVISYGAAGQLSEKRQRSENPGSAPAVVIRTSADARPASYDAGSARFLLSRNETGGRYSVVELQELPGYSTPLHAHRDMDEAFYVLEGTLTAEIAGKRYELTPGASVIIPKGTPHAQGNFGKWPVRLLVTSSPGGIEQFFLDRADLFKTMTPENPEFGKRMAAIIDRNGIDVIGPWKP